MAVNLSLIEKSLELRPIGLVSTLDDWSTFKSCGHQMDGEGLRRTRRLWIRGRPGAKQAGGRSATGL